MTRTSLLHLSAGQAHVDIVPEIGGSLAGYWSETDEGPKHWLRPLSVEGLEAKNVLATSCFPLVPFSNRIRNGRFSFAGNNVSLPLNFGDHPHAIHGQGWQQPWSVEEATADTACLSFRHKAGSWPWDFTARQRFALTADTLTIVLEICNQSLQDMPAGLGFHPYFPRTPKSGLTARVEEVWQIDEEVMPLHLEPVSGDMDPGAGLLADKIVLDNCYAGWDRQATVVWPEHRAELIVRASIDLDTLVLFTPPSEDFLCIEPVSHCTDAFNLAAAGMADTGMMVLSPGQTWAVSMTLQTRFLSDD